MHWRLEQDVQCGPERGDGLSSGPLQGVSGGGVLRRAVSDVHGRGMDLRAVVQERLFAGAVQRGAASAVQL